MTPASQPDHHRPGRTSLRGQLMAAVRPEFRADMLVFDAEDPVFGTGACLVPACRRHVRNRGLCQGHHLRWKAAGRPDVEGFAASTDPRWSRQQPNSNCQVAACGYGSARQGMCDLHGQRWIRAGRPDLERWLTAPPAIPQPPPGASCLITYCELWPHSDSVFCHSHTKTWQVNGHPEPAGFAAAFESEVIPSDQVVRFEGLAPQLKLELQYALQCRAGQRASKTSPSVVMQVVRFLATASETSLLQASEADWRGRIGRPAPKDSNPRALLIYARQAAEDLAAGAGWEAEYPRDQWRLRRLGVTDANRTLRFDEIEQPQFRELAKRWARWRISCDLSYEAVRRGIAALVRFARFLNKDGARIEVLAQLDRPVLERYLADLHAEYGGNAQRQGSHIGLLNQFFHAVRQHQWDTSLPSTAMFFSQDYPKRTERLPRALAEHVMAQVEQPDNLDRFDSPAYGLVTLILIRCGLRVTDALKLAFDCLVTDTDGAPYLRYVNHKMKRDALVPVDEEIVHLIHDQQARVQARWTDGSPLLFPRPTKNVDGQHPTAGSTYRLALYRWLERCKVRDEYGRPAHLTPHQWRHTLGTRMINRDVPQEVVRRILDHDSPQMTAHYARLHDTTVREHWEKARKINISGQAVRLDPEGPLAEAAWAKHRLSRATQALPNGYCQLPVQQSCPHANACLTCPMFVTTPDFLPQHRHHRTEILQIISAAEARGQQRLVEMNQQVLSNLDTIITSLAVPVSSQPEGAADAS
ncbi:tyrosine-type recombinase/integrase [Actinacidiphila soli]|uniref:tyrosine-type recombinase/integrase n=1 Tax=Actinacidiphila soli TaxID=2487275 RepID=UPI001F0C6F24|nr:tyrosine-type recombinase/integrase [Actinacidiphila soli]